MKTATLPTDEILKTMAAEAVKQQHHLRETVRDLTLKALQARELNLIEIELSRLQRLECQIAGPFLVGDDIV